MSPLGVVVKKAQVGTSMVVGAVVVGVGLSWALHRSTIEEDNGSFASAPVDPEVYRPAKLVSYKAVGAGAKVLKFRFSQGPGISPIRPFSHISLKGRSYDVPPEYPFGLNVERYYTPIAASRRDFEILVRSYPKEDAGKPDLEAKEEPESHRGLTSRFLLSLEPGATVEVKGPVPTSKNEMTKDALTSRKQVAMVCGGSGITPAIQMLSRLSSADSGRHFSILWSNRSENQMFFRKELESMAKSMRNVSLRYTLTRTSSPGWEHDTGRVSKELLRARLPPPGPECLIIVCGPDSFVQAIAGGSRRADRSWFGELGGFLKELGYTDEHVLRL